MQLYKTILRTTGLVSKSVSVKNKDYSGLKRHKAIKVLYTIRSWDRILAWMVSCYEHYFGPAGEI